MNKKFREPSKPIGTVAELFAGVGGFRIGLANAGWKTVFSNQWEPSTKIQHASKVYVSNFGKKGHVCEDVSKIEKIPSKIDLLVGGFPCQDYSVAKSLNTSRGLRGKKGVLWWEILRLVEVNKPKFIFLENVDRLLKSPSAQRGRDFAIMLRTLGDAGYMVEWRVINAAEYGFPQRRIRVFIVARRLSSIRMIPDPTQYISESGILAKAFPASLEHITCTDITLNGDLESISRNFNKSNGAKSPFLNSGVFIDNHAFTIKTQPITKRIRHVTLGDVLQKESEIDASFYIHENQLKEWKFLKGAKKLERIHKKSGAKYEYAEGAIAFPDSLSKPSRTILTAEGGSSPSRFRHVIKTKKGYRRLTPIELERLNGFPDDWTRFDDEGREVSDTKRAFFMGNALVIGLVERVGRVLAQEMQRKR